MSLEIKPGKYRTRGGAVVWVDALVDAKWRDNGYAWTAIEAGGTDYRVTEDGRYRSETLYGRIANYDSRFDLVARIEDEAHMMSAPERQHVSDAAMSVYCSTYGTKGEYVEKDLRRDGLVLLTVAEHDELLKRQRVPDLAFTDAIAERDALRAEVERLHRDLRNADAALADMDERLRGAKDEARPQCSAVQTISGQSTGEQSSVPVRDFVRASFVSTAHTLDPRLGIPQPEGEPTEPMSSRKPYRWAHAD